MKRFIKTNELVDIYLSENPKDIDEIIGMSNLSPRRSGLSVVIWSDGQGVLRKVEHNTPRLKIGKPGEFAIVVSIEPEPKILSQTKNIKKSELAQCKEAMDYVGRNYDLFLKHFNDTDFSFDDEDLANALRERGEYK